jgi:glycosyltransferase involved in cell wall biosynthesis
MEIFWFIAIVLIILYCAWIGLFYHGWNSTAPWDLKDSKNPTCISVVVPVRNEETHISRLLTDLVKQEYPVHLFEVIIVDDQSSDGTPVIAEDFCSRHKNFHYIKLSGKEEGKKAALRLGINSSRFSYILTTDADCRVNSGWINVMADCFRQSGPDLIAGPVVLHGEENFFSKFQQLEHLSLQGATAGAIEIGQAVMCSAANLGFRKAAYFEAFNHHKQQVSSGDDVFLLHGLQREGDKKIVFIKHHDAIVSTAVKKTLRDFLDQRSRWTSKSLHYETKASVFTAVLVFMVHLYFIICLVTGIMSPGFLSIATFIFMFKSLIDYPFLHSVARYFEKSRLLVYFPAIQMVYFFYINYTVFTSFVRVPEWKGRRINY